MSMVLRQSVALCCCVRMTSGTDGAVRTARLDA